MSTTIQRLLRTPVSQSQLEADQFYLSSSDSFSYWGGEKRVFQFFDLDETTKVDPSSDLFQTIFLGSHPSTGIKLRHMTKSTTRSSVCAWDIVSRVPRDIELLYGNAEVHRKKDICIAHRDAVNSVRCWIDNNASFTRRGNGGKITEPVSLLSAHFEYTSGDRPTPFCYTHSLYFNAGIDSQGVSRTLYEYPLVSTCEEMNSVYETHLQSNLKRLGISFMNDETEIDGFTVNGEHIFIETVRESSGKDLLIRDVLKVMN